LVVECSALDTNSRRLDGVDNFEQIGVVADVLDMNLSRSSPKDMLK